MAIAAFLTADRDRVRDATNLTGWGDRPFRADVSARVGLPVVVENDADAAVWGEYTHGAATGERCVAMATVGTGIGGGVVIDGNLISGGFGLAANSGTSWSSPAGASAAAVHAAASRHTRAGPRSRDPPARRRPPTQWLHSVCSIAPAAIPSASTARPSRRCALEGDPLARRVIAELGEWLGTGLAQVTAVLDPSVIVVGGGLVDAAASLIVEPTRVAYASASSIHAVRQVAPLHAAGLGNAAGLVGAGTRAAMAGAGVPTLSAVD